MSFNVLCVKSIINAIKLVELKFSPCSRLLLLMSVSFFVLSLSLQFSTPLTAEVRGGALRTPTRVCLTPAQPRRWRSANYKVERGNEGTPGGQKSTKGI